MALPVTISGISTAVACVGPFKSTNAAIVSTGITAVSEVIVFGSASGGQEKAGQTWTTDAAATPIKSVTFSILRNGSPTDNLVVDIYATSGGVPTGASLAQSASVAASSLGASLGDIVTFTFASAFTPSASTLYAAVASRTGSLSNTNRYGLYGDGAGGYANGSTVSFSNSGSWGAFSSDATFAASGATAFFFIGRDSSSSTALDAYKATDPTSSWSQIDTDPAVNQIEAIAATQVGDVIHIAVIAAFSATSVSLAYLTFDMSIDSFVLDEVVASAFDPTTNSGGAQYACSIGLRSDGDVIILYNGPRGASMGSSYSRIVYARREGGTWTSGVAVDAGGQVNFELPEVVMGSSDRAHFFWRGLGQAESRALTSANSLQTMDPETLASSSAQIWSGLSYDDAGTQRVIVGGTFGASGGDISVFRYNSADAPTITRTLVNAASNYTRLFEYNATVYALYVLNSDSDLRVESSTDDGATWGSQVTAFSGITGIGLSHDGDVYQRGLSIVIPYIVNDNGTLKYNEYTIATALADAWSAIDKSSGITLSNSDKTATAGGVGGVRSTTGHLTTSTDKYYAELVLTNSVTAGSYPLFGLQPTGAELTQTTISILVSSAGVVSRNGGLVGVDLGSDFVDGDVVSIAWSPAANLIWFRVNAGNWNANASADPVTGSNGIDTTAVGAGTYCLWAAFSNNAEAITIRTEAAEFTQTPPVGFLSWMGETLTQPKAPTPYKQAPRFIRRMR